MFIRPDIKRVILFLYDNYNIIEESFNWVKITSTLKSIKLFYSLEHSSIILYCAGNEIDLNYFESLYIEFKFKKVVKGFYIRKANNKEKNQLSIIKQIMG